MVASCTPPTGNQAGNPGMCPDPPESNRRPLSSQAGRCSVLSAAPARGGILFFVDLETRIAPVCLTGTSSQIVQNKSQFPPNLLPRESDRGEFGVKNGLLLSFCFKFSPGILTRKLASNGIISNCIFFQKILSIIVLHYSCIIKLGEIESKESHI